MNIWIKNILNRNLKMAHTMEPLNYRITEHYRNAAYILLYWHGKLPALFTVTHTFQLSVLGVKWGQWEWALRRIEKLHVIYCEVRAIKEQPIQ